MKRKGSLITVLLILSMCNFADFIHVAEETEEIQIITQVVTVNLYEVLQPSTVASTPATTVVWVNSSQFPMEILFPDKKVALACGSPVNFFVGKSGAFESAKIPRGGTASLCFTQKGKYEYVVRSSRTLLLEYGKQKRRERRGTIIIR